MKKNWTRGLLAVGLIAAAGFGLAGCEEEKKPELAPAATDLKASAPKAPDAVKLAIEKASSKVEFMMEAPQEKIRGRVSGTTEGEIQVDPSDLTKTTGLITVDIAGIELFQAVASDDGKFGEEKKSDLQNEHARTWLEISPDAPADVRAKNAKTQFAIRKIEVTGERNLMKLTGPERKVMLKATGEFLLHQRASEKTAELEATFKFEGDKPVGVRVKTVKPFTIGLAEHEVHPRESFGKLAQKTLELLAPKVAKEAFVSLEFSATPGMAGPGAMGGKPAEAPAAPGTAMPAKDAPK